MSKQTCILEDGRRVTFSVKKRGRDPFYLVSFRGPNGRRLERTTKEENQRRACDSAVVIIKEEFAPKRLDPAIAWDDALQVLEDYMRADNLRQTTIDDYKINIGNLRKAFPETRGPVEITSEMAERYKAIRSKDRTIETIRGNLVTLGTVYGKWWIKICRILTTNPFANIRKPKVDRCPPRIVTDDEQQAFLTWLHERWDGWRLPTLFLEVKWAVGCRITELASAATNQLQGGRIRFEAETTKGRKQRSAKVPQHLYAELQNIAGKTYVFERYSGQLRSIHIKRGKPHHAKCIVPYRPDRLKDWLERQVQEYFETHPDVKRFKLHNFRGTAMSRARTAGVSYDDASIAFGCHPETMRKHYLNLDEESIADRVMDRIQESSDPKSGEKSGEISPPPSSQPPTGNAA